MCEFCTKHGEGKKWYLNAKNYSDDLLSDINRRNFVRDFNYWANRCYKRYFNLINALPLRTPIIGPALRAIIKRIFVYDHWGQVVPIEDIENILSMANSITRLPCICRKVLMGKEIRMGFAVSLSPQSMGIADLLDESFFRGPDIRQFEKISKDDALNFMKEQEKDGIYHSIWTFKSPFKFCSA